MPDVPANRVPGDEADGLVASCVVDSMAAVGAFYRCSTGSDVYHPLLERVAPGMAENEAGFISCFIVMLYFRDRYIPDYIIGRFGRYRCGFREGHGRELSRGIVELAKDPARLVRAPKVIFYRPG